MSIKGPPILKIFTTTTSLLFGWCGRNSPFCLFWPVIVIFSRLTIGSVRVFVLRTWCSFQGDWSRAGRVNFLFFWYLFRSSIIRAWRVGSWRWSFFRWRWGDGCRRGSWARICGLDTVWMKGYDCLHDVVPELDLTDLQEILVEFLEGEGEL